MCQYALYEHYITWCKINVLSLLTSSSSSSSSSSSILSFPIIWYSASVRFCFPQDLQTARWLFNSLHVGQMWNVGKLLESWYIIALLSKYILVNVIREKIKPRPPLSQNILHFRFYFWCCSPPLFWTFYTFWDILLGWSSKGTFDLNEFGLLPICLRRRGEGNCAWKASSKY